MNDEKPPRDRSVPPSGEQPTPPAEDLAASPPPEEPAATPPTEEPAAESDADQPARRRSRWPLIAIIGGLVIACACVAIAGVMMGSIVLTSSAGPNSAVTRYYDAARAGDYDTAYAQLTPGFASEISPTDLRDNFAAAEAQDGPITDFSIEGTRIEGSLAEVDAIVTRERAGGLVTVQLVQSGDRWLIDNFASP